MDPFLFQTTKVLYEKIYIHTYICKYKILTISKIKYTVSIRIWPLKKKVHNSP